MVRTEDGLRVYSPANPAKPYMVSATRGIPSVAVLNFPRRRQPNTARISAQYSIRLGGQSGAPAEDSYAREERLAIQNEGRAAPDRGQQRGPAVMLLKRSVSPDGRIDSLSVEFTRPAEDFGLSPVSIF
jgi:hypothetical protein